MKKHQLIPVQTAGNHLDIIESREFLNEQAAIEFFEKVNLKLFDINNWHQVCRSTSSKFYLKSGKDLSSKQTPEVGDFICIDIPGPSTLSGKGYDWVKIEAISKETNNAGEVIAMTVRPHSNPTKDLKNIAHFFTEDSTSTFMITRQNNFVTAEVHGRNEISNLKTSVFSDNLRNRMVSWGAVIGLSYPQWKSLALGLVK